MFLGRPVRPGQDPEWTKSDRDHALAWQAERAEQCAGCGRQWSETTADDSDEDYDAHLVVCNACAERSRKRRELSRQDGDVDGVYIAIRRRPDLE